MSEWEIVRIEEDPGPTPAEDRWLVSYRVPLEYSPDGTFSYSFPKSSMNKFAALYEYDIDDPTHVDELFDYIMSRPMLVARPLDAGVPAGHPALLTAEVVTRVESASAAVNVARLAAHPTHALNTPPEQLRAAIKAGIQAMKDGEVPLVAGGKVQLGIRGMPQQSDGAENPKYILKRDLVARLDRDHVAAQRGHFQRERAALAARRSGDAI